MTDIKNYLKTVDQQYKTGIATEHSYRSYLQTLVQQLIPKSMVTNEPARINCGAPDYIITRNEIPLGYIEAKDVGAALDHKSHKEQFTRYLKSLNNLIITNYLEFRLYRDGELVNSVSIGKTQENKIISLPANFPAFLALFQDFGSYDGQTINSAAKLSKMMAAKARLLANVIEIALTSDEQSAADSTLKDQMQAFKDILIHDIQPKEFADIYAQTIAYGMFAARLHDPTVQDFSRQEAAQLIPKSNPFLRKLFQYIAGYDLDERIDWLVDSLADMFRATDLEAIMRDYGRDTEQTDPMIHFYETFLAEYDPKLRKSRGVWYTPEPVVNFIVRAVDDILKTEFGLPQGLADSSKTTIELKTQTADGRFKENYKREKQEMHRVQILDPAAGTGTFLAEIVRQIHRKFEGQQGVWNNYVEEHLIPRLNGFEILMASYAMAHLKLETLLRETGYQPTKNQRLRIFLTNSLEEHHPDTGTLFANWLSQEAAEANYIKRDTPVMVVLGNPPYSVSSSNKGEWIQNLIVDYKKNLNEKKINLDDDYIKFIRYGEYFIEKNGEGVLAFISNNSFIDGVTHRQMRKHLLECFDKIYIIDLHGSIKKNETTKEGTKDDNVFDIQQGVSINIFIKTSYNKSLAEINHLDIFGLRENKYRFLNSTSIKSINWKKIRNQEPYYFFIPKDFSFKEKYDEGIQINSLFLECNSGVQTKCDPISIKFELDEIKSVMKKFSLKTIDELKSIFSTKKESSGWNFKNAKESIISEVEILNINYRAHFKN